MPIIEINMLEGRSDEMKETLIYEISQTASKVLDAPIESVRVMINELPKQHFGIAGTSVKKLGR